MASEEIAAQATIAAANIQANMTMYAAVISALVIVMGLLISWLTALHLQKVARIADTRKIVYLELVEHYALIIYSLENLVLDIETNLPINIGQLEKLCSSLEKSAFICKTKNKREILIFLKFLRNEIKPIIKFANTICTELIILNVLHNNYEKALNNAEKLNNTIQSLIHDKNQKYELENLIKQLEYANKDILKFSEEYKPIENKIAKMHKKLLEDINIFTGAIRLKFIPISHSIKSELGATTDVGLDYKILNLK